MINYHLKILYSNEAVKFHDDGGCERCVWHEHLKVSDTMYTSTVQLES